MSEVIVNRFQSLAIRRFAVVFTGATPRRDDPANWDGGTIPWINSGAVNQRRIVRHSSLITKRGFQSSSTKWIPAGSVVIAMAGQGKTKGMAATVERPMTGNQSLAALIVNRRIMDYRYLAFALEPEYRNLRGVVGNEERSGLSLQDIRSFKIPVPSLEEQGLIVRYLDHAELRIAKTIVAKQRMIALLDEREELVLLEAISQSDQPMTTDSRLDWLGEFPAHWAVKRLGSLLEERNEMNADRQIQQVLSLVRKRGVMRYEDKGRIGNKRSDDVARYKVVREGDIVLNSMNVIIGSVGQSSYTGCLSPVYYVLKPRSNELHNSYFNALFQVERFHSSLVRFGKGILAHRLRIPMIDLKTVMLPVPPPDEQLAIADRVVKATAELKAAKAGIEAEIALLREYRTRLISDVVTGKLDVRDEAATLLEIDPMELATAAVGENGDDEEATDDD